MARRDVREPGDYGDSYKPKEEQAKVIAPIADEQSDSEDTSSEDKL
jgi:cell division protease FtsH